MSGCRAPPNPSKQWPCSYYAASTRPLTEPFPRQFTNPSGRPPSSGPPCWQRGHSKETWLIRFTKNATEPNIPIIVQCFRTLLIEQKTSVFEAKKEKEKWKEFCCMPAVIKKCCWAEWLGSQSRLVPAGQQSCATRGHRTVLPGGVRLSGRWEKLDCSVWRAFLWVVLHIYVFIPLSVINICMCGKFKVAYNRDSEPVQLLSLLSVQRGWENNPIFEQHPWFKCLWMWTWHSSTRLWAPLEAAAPLQLGGVALMTPLLPPPRSSRGKGREGGTTGSGSGVTFKSCASPPRLLLTPSPWSSSYNWTNNKVQNSWPLFHHTFIKQLQETKIPWHSLF